MAGHEISPNDSERIQALRTLCAAIFGRSNLIGTDFADVDAYNIERRFSQGESGVLLQFSISSHALGKIASKEVGDALKTLLAGKGAG